MNPILLNEIPNEINTLIGEITEITFPRQGYTSDVGVLQTEKGKFLLKRSKGEQFSEWLSQEIFVLKVLSKTEIPVPKLLHHVIEENQTWALMEFIEGETLRNYLYQEKDKVKRHQAICSFGKTLAQIHRTICPNEFIGDKPWLDERLEKAQFNLENYGTEGSKELLEKLNKQRPAPHPQTLIHGDFTIDNVLVKNGKVTSVIDWSGGAYGDPRYDVSLAIRPKPNAFEDETDKEIFFKGYGKKIITKEDYLYFENGLYAFF